MPGIESVPQWRRDALDGLVTKSRRDIVDACIRMTSWPGRQMKAL